MNPDREPKAAGKTTKTNKSVLRTATTDYALSRSDTALSSSPTEVAESTRTHSSVTAVTASRHRSFIEKNGRTYMYDPENKTPYPFPCDLNELHRQALRTMVLIQLFGAPVASPVLRTNPPKRVLEINCGTGFWSMMCHRYFKERGHTDISFTGMNLVPLGPGTSSPENPLATDKDMQWHFVQHDFTQIPWPFPDASFDMVINKDGAVATPMSSRGLVSDEVMRVTKKGGTVEIWETDHLIRMIRKHTPAASEGAEAVLQLGAYPLDVQTPISAPRNSYLVDYNRWLTQAFADRNLLSSPCTEVSATLYQEADVLTDICVKRVAIPLSEITWEREGVGGVITKGGKPYVDTQKDKPASSRPPLTREQLSLRKTTLMTLLQGVQALELVLREASGKSQDEWDIWLTKMTNNLMYEDGAIWGECVEAGAWSARRI